MKAISIRQPMAMAVVLGAKTIETRSWATSYTGPLLIHAARHFIEDDFENLMEDTNWRAVLSQNNRSRMALGAIIGKVQLVRCVPVSDIPDAVLDEKRVRDKCRYRYTERALGTYTEGRYGLVMEKPRMLRQPLPYTGQLGIFEVPDKLLGDCVFSVAT